MNWRGVRKNQDWVDMSKEALILAMHVFDMAKTTFKAFLNHLPDFVCETFHRKCKKGMKIRREIGTFRRLVYEFPV